MSFGSDAAAMAPEGVFLKSSTHPRAYGSFARLLGKYGREERRVALAEAVRRLAALPAQNLKIADRGQLKDRLLRGYRRVRSRQNCRRGNLC
jgi:N-acyl-D-amino-acid deacylase